MSNVNNAAVSGAKVRKKVVNVIVHIFLAILAFIWVMPIFWVVLTSFRGEKGSYVTTFFPKTYTLDNYVKLFTDTSILNFPQMFLNTFVIAIFTCIISTVFVLSVSYTMSRMRFKMRKPYMNIAMILGLFPSFMSMIAVYYILNLDSVFNKKYFTDGESNLYTENPSEIRFKDATLLKVQDGKVVEAYEGKDSIITYLKKKKKKTEE